MAAAAALNGRLTDVRKYTNSGSDAAKGNKSASHLKVTSALDFVHEIAPPSPPLSEDEDAITLAKAKPANPGSARWSKFILLKGIAAPMDMENINTDVIISVRFLKGLKRTGLGKHVFDALRVSPHTGERTNFVLNRAPFDKARILVCTGSNFGCGSSREAAPWSL
jgi:3-isopropylmalate dehydratase